LTHSDAKRNFNITSRVTVAQERMWKYRFAMDFGGYTSQYGNDKAPHGRRGILEANYLVWNNMKGNTSVQQVLDNFGVDLSCDRGVP
jgi:hypothetical protein